MKKTEMAPLEQLDNIESSYKSGRRSFHDASGAIIRCLEKTPEADRNEPGIRAWSFFIPETDDVLPENSLLYIGQIVSLLPEGRTKHEMVKNTIALIRQEVRQERRSSFDAGFHMHTLTGCLPPGRIMNDQVRDNIIFWKEMFDKRYLAADEAAERIRDTVHIPPGKKAITDDTLLAAHHLAEHMGKPSTARIAAVRLYELFNILGIADTRSTSFAVSPKIGSPPRICAVFRQAEGGPLAVAGAKADTIAATMTRIRDTHAESDEYRRKVTEFLEQFAPS